MIQSPNRRLIHVLWKKTAVSVLLACAVPVSAQTADASVPVEKTESSKVATAMQVVLALFPREKAREDALSEFEASFRKSFSDNPNSVALNRRYPGLLEEMVKAGRTEMRRLLETQLEQELLSRMAEQVAAQLSHGEISKLLEFYESPAGQALGRLDPSSMDPETGLVSIEALKMEHRVAIGQFQRSPIGRRSGVLITSLSSQMRTMAAQVMQPHVPKLNSTIQAVARRYISIQSEGSS